MIVLRTKRYALLPNAGTFKSVQTYLNGASKTARTALTPKVSPFMKSVQNQAKINTGLLRGTNTLPTTTPVKSVLPKIRPRVMNAKY